MWQLVHVTVDDTLLDVMLVDLTPVVQNYVNDRLRRVLAMEISKWKILQANVGRRAADKSKSW